MKFSGAIALVTSVAWYGVAQAEISEDLKFCANLKISRERLACYDAAARVENRTTSKAETTQPVVVKALPLQSKAALSRFDRAYVAITGGYDFAQSKPNSVAGLANTTQFDAINGPKIGGVVGYNATTGALLLGFEARAQYSFGDSHISNAAFGGTFTAKAQRPLSADVSTRAGLIFGDWLTYARVGAGAEQAKSTFTAVLPGSVSNTVWASARPTVVLAAGVERNFADFFARVEAEMTTHFGPSVGFSGSPYGNVYYTPAINVAAGYRF